MGINLVSIGKVIEQVGSMVPGITGIICGTGKIIDDFNDIAQDQNATPERRILKEIEAGHDVNVQEILAENDGKHGDDAHHTKEAMPIAPFMFTAAIEGIKSALNHHDDGRQKQIVSTIRMLMAYNLQEPTRFNYGPLECDVTTDKIKDEINDPDTRVALTALFNEYHQKLLAIVVPPKPSSAVPAVATPI